MADYQGKQLQPQKLFSFLLQKDKKGKQKVFHNVGPLTAYLLVADYVYAGLVTQPSAADIAFFICTINRGAFQALLNLRLLPSAAKVEDCTAAVTHVWQYLDKHLPDDSKAQMPFDFILIEHALCKVTRLKLTPGSIPQ